MVLCFSFLGFILVILHHLHSAVTSPTDLSITGGAPRFPAYQDRAIGPRSASGWAPLGKLGDFRGTASPASYRTNKIQNESYIP